MNRRSILKQGAAVLTGASALLSQTPPAGREYYELRRYHLSSGPQTKQLDAYLAEALVPALNRLGMSPVGVFNLYLGPETPSTYLLIPSMSLERLVTAEMSLANDDEYRKRGEKFLTAPASSPAFDRLESSLSVAFQGWPKLVLPPPSRSNGPRVFQWRTYESPSHRDHVVKVKMFEDGEFQIFERAGFWPVFFGDTLIGSRVPNLTYMLSFPDLAELNAKWKAFSNDPEWKKLSGRPEYNFEPTVSNISNLILNPATYSQI